MRHLAIGGGLINRLDDLRTPMSVILDNLTIQLTELERYKARYGPLIVEDSDSELDSDVYEDAYESEFE